MFRGQDKSGDINNMLASPNERSEARQMLLGKNFLPYLNKSDQRRMQSEIVNHNRKRRGKKYDLEIRQHNKQVKELTNDIRKRMAMKMRIDFQQVSPLVTEAKKKQI